ncbi:MAG: hypothetical protein COV67_09670 [Nitrospinae bacterium CG11_big_fil_rev_8_21_14_0_20_56_8]|nr:MAG: hypothetical protein COV67_09670 [Nitrospinae bacterium CG11_big_fil_rev_8_21_14_0_20_56_8]
MSIKFTYLKTGDVETTESFFSNRLLSARIKSGVESNLGYDQILEEGRDEEWKDTHWSEIRDNQLKYEEDVNQYITLTLSALANPKTLGLVNKYLVRLDADAGQMLKDVEGSSQKFFLYRINADFLLMYLGLFSPNSNLLGDAYFDKGGFYYNSAATSLKGMVGGRSGLSDVMEKLASGFGKYVEILRSMKNHDDNFLSFNFRLSTTEMQNLEETLKVEVRNRKKPDASDS